MVGLFSLTSHTASRSGCTRMVSATICPNMPRKVCLRGRAILLLATVLACAGGAAVSHNCAAGEPDGTSNLQSNEKLPPMFVAVGAGMLRVISTDGQRWDHEMEQPDKAREKPYLLRGVTASDNMIVAVGNYIVASRDGKSWQQVNDQRNWLGDVAYGNGMFVAVGYHRSVHSRDGITWSAPLRNPQVSGRKIAFGRGRFVAVGWMSEPTGQAGYATATEDALNWTNTRLADGKLPRDVAYGNGRFVIVGSHGLRESSTDGVRWEHRSLGDDDEELRQVVWTGAEFVAIGSRGGYRSPDGIAWKKWTTRTPSSLAYGDGLFVGCSAGKFSYSKDGTNWMPAQSRTTSQVLKIIHVPSPARDNPTKRPQN